MKKMLLVFLAFTLLNVVKAQETNFWSSHTNADKIITDKAVARLAFPAAFKLFDLNIEPLRQELFSIVDNHTSRHSTVISLPNADGQIEQFEVFEASNFEPALQARFPEIRAFSGKGITDRYATLKLSISPQGIQTMVFRTDKANEFIEAYSKDHTVYAVFRSQRKPGQLPWTCTTEDKKLAVDINSQISRTNVITSSTGELRTMRLAQSCNGEYANFFGAFSATDVALVLAAYNATLTRCNGCYEKDLAIHLNLIANTTAVIYYDPATDPYTTLANWNAQEQTVMTNIIGEANYDIGHMFGASGGGGNAGCIGCVCVNGQKGSGITSPADGIPQGDNFDIDYVVHEVGHQMGANHTFSFQLEGTGVNKEIGSGITIMGYAGITAQDVAPHSIDIYHEASIAQIQANMATKACPVTTNISANNATPVVAPVSNFTIPISTPFALTGSATDANPGDALTYCWEQNDNSTTSGTSSVASPTKTTGPNWLSFSPTASPTRYCPQLSTILAGALITGPLPGGDAGTNIEALSSVARTLNFRLTVRDNCPYSSTAPLKIGQTAFTDMVVTVSAVSGPFAVTIPNTNVSWAGNSSQNITWSVASTTAAPVSCANVKISLSTDGGLTFPTVLAASTPNDGTEVLTIPNTPTTTARIKVEAVGNIFFDISNTNFTITNAITSGFDFNNPAATNIACNGSTTATATLGTISIGGYTTPINLSATSGVPAGTTVGFSVNPVVPGNSTVVTLNNTNTLSPGTYNITITGVSGANTQTRVLSFVVQPGTAPTITTQPANQTLCAGSNAPFSVVASGVTITGYQWQLSTDGGANFSNIVGATSSSYTQTSITLAQNNYRYRVIVSGQCGSVTSNAATLTVSSAPSTPVITPASATICLGQVQSLSATSTISNLFKFGTDTTTNTTTSTSTDYPAPYSVWYGGQRMQMLILASELTAAGFSNGSQLNNIQFPVVSLGSGWGSTITSLQSFKVSIGATALTTISAFQSGLTTVVAAANFTPVAGYTNTHTFSTPFTWNGSSNIIIETTFSNNITGTSSTTVTQYNSPAGFQSCIVYRADAVTAAAAAAATTVTYSLTSRPDFKLNGSTVAPITWSPTAGLFTDALATSGYTGTPAALVYAKPSATGVSTFTATATAAGCSSNSNVSVTVNQVPVAPSGTGASTCGTGTVNISATPAAGETIDWYAASSGGAPLQSSSTSFTTPSISITTTYYAEARNIAAGCISGTRTAVTATVNSAPAAPSGTGNSRCGTGTVTISATPGAGETIDWYAASSGGAPLQSGSTSFTTPSISITTTYYAETRNTTTGCISATRTGVTATVGTIPAVPSGTNAARCGTGTVIISATPGAGETIDWYAAASGGAALLSGNTSFTTPSISITTTYFAQSRNTTTGCISATRTSVTATVNSVPATPSGTGAARCGTGTVTIPATPGAGETIDWYAASSGGAPLQSSSTSFTTPSISITTTYFAEARNTTTGCISVTRTSVTATVNSVPVAPSGTGAARCGTGTVTISATPGVGETIDWYAAASGGAPLQSSVTSFTTPSISITTTYFAQSRNTTTGCISATRTSVTATINSVPVAPSGTNAARCGTGTVTISATPGAGETIDWYAASSGGAPLQSGSTSFTTPSISITTTYFAQSRNTTTGCISATRTSVTATVNSVPTVPSGTSNSRCGTGTVTISATPGVGETIDWYAASSGGAPLQSSSTSFTTPSISITTTYFAEARNTTTGCISATRTSVTATINPVPAVPSGTGNSRCGTGTVTISATPGVGETIDWYAASSGGAPLQSGSTSFTTPSISITTTYFAQSRNTTTGCISATRTGVTATVNTLPAAPSGTGNSRCGTGTVTISATPSAGETIDWYAAASGGAPLLSSSTSFTTPSISVTTTYFAEARNTTTGCISATRTGVTATVNSCSATLNLKVYLQGYYNGGGLMVPVLSNEGFAAANTKTDTVTVELHNATTPFALATPAVKSIINTDGTGTFVFPVSGSYYIVVKHRNSVQTWSAAPVALNGTVTYDFTTAANKAYGNNMIQIGTIWALYTGDINQDNNIDILDFFVLAPGIDVNNGYYSTDLNGDGNVDILDFFMLAPNIDHVNSVHP